VTTRAPAYLAACITALLVILFAGAAAPAAAATPATNGLPYVAMGDSFAAGYGIAPTTDKPVVGCGQSQLDYPHLVAKELGMRLTDVSCAGAVTANLISTPQSTPSGTAPAQLTALGRDTKVVTITIGGNDLGFFDTTASCITLFANGPILTEKQPNCRATLVKNGKDALAERIAGPLLTGTGSAPGGLTKAFAAVKAAAPNAAVIVVGYPTIMPNSANTPASGCFSAPVEGKSLQSFRMDNGMPFTEVDIAYLHSVEQKLDVATKNAAERAHFSYVSVLGKTASRSACAPPATAYVNGVRLQVKAGDLSIDPGTLHPNAAGAAFLARTVVSEVKQQLPPAAATSAPQGKQQQPGPLWPWVVLPIGLALILAAVILTLARRQRRTRRSR
jgi:lysophospholipase L1-like esterase